VTDTGKLVFFPGFNDTFKPGDTMASVDDHFANTSDFEQLQATVAQNATGLAQVAWRGNN
tara:strand:+ start:83442 stop:83621 length:180 start_codon:yes stop_codon:yes gene_type:complete